MGSIFEKNMKKKYVCGRIAPQELSFDSAVRLTAQAGQIDLYPWANGSYTPHVEFRLLHDSEALYVRFDVWESNIRATYTCPNDPVCRDSCVEFFFHPQEDDPRYLSFEVNPLGTMLIGLSTSGQDLQYLTEDRELFCIQARQKQDFWQVAYRIPFSFIRRYFSGIGPVMGGNFMKCADRSVTPHHGCWNLIETPIPMFHVPQFFGEIELVDITRE